MPILHLHSEILLKDEHKYFSTISSNLLTSYFVGHLET